MMYGGKVIKAVQSNLRLETKAASNAKPTLTLAPRHNYFKNMKKRKVGRPTVMNEETLRKLREGFLMGFTDEEACSYAAISTTPFYEYQDKTPEFKEQKEAWKRNPTLVAKTTLYQGLTKEENAKWYLERKKKDEFSLRSEITGSNGEALQIEFVDEIKRV